MTTFQLHPRLQQDSIFIACFELSQLRLINDCSYPWFILVPQRFDVREVFQLDDADRLQLHDESCLLAEKLNAVYKADKMNIAAIGNVVPQLHIHHIVRYKNDKAWPAPVWGKFDAVPYSDDEISQQVELIQKAFPELS
ncbi:MAG: HIT domain-containing protein [Methylococcaceae bacterium]|nr:HIT domain-containing protein [Methylococcaceae bacterium]